MDIYRESFFNNLGITVNNNKSNPLLRIGYFCWVINGRNDLSSISTYVDKEFTDEFCDVKIDNGVIGAIGARFRNWMTSNSTLKAYKKNVESTETGVTNEKIVTKPVGFDQLKHAYLSIIERNAVTTCNFYVPEIDLKIPFSNVDLINVSFVLERNVVDMVLNFTDYDSDGYQVNEVWSMMVIHRLLCQMTNNYVGKVHLNACRSFSKSSIIFNELSDTKFDHLEKYGTETFQEDLVYFSDFEKHLKMQVNLQTMNNPMVVIPQLIEKLEKKLIDSIQGVLLKDLARALLILTIKKYAGKNEYYDEMTDRLRELIVSENVLAMVNNG